jgi:7-cyano-7-deazaguanine synthase
MSKAVVLLSGGLDSATVLALARKEHKTVYALTLNYGQSHAREIRSARRLAEYFKVARHEILTITLPWKGSALLDKKIRIPQHRSLKDLKPGIPATYVPARNTLFLSYALSWAEVIGAHSVYIGANAVDYSGYPDCRPTYLKVMDRIFQLGTQAGEKGHRIRIQAPLVRMSKKEIIRFGTRLKVPYHMTWSCYRGGRKPCGKCDSCLLRAKGFNSAGIKDPLK